MKSLRRELIKPFCLAVDADQPGRKMSPFLASLVEKTLGLDSMNHVYDQIVQDSSPRHFSERALDVLNVTCRVAAGDLERVPRTGPLVVVANHPFGGLEGVILEAILRRVRPDVKLLVNYLLHCIPDLRDSYFFVDPFGRPDSARRNIASLRQSMEWVGQSHVLGVFPAGEVSHLRRSAGGVTDPPWNTTIARIAFRTKAAVLPVFFEGRNSGLFQLMGLFHPRLRTAMLAHELLRKQHGEVTVRIGNVIPADRIQEFDDVQGLTDYLRVRTYILGSAAPATARKTSPDATGRKTIGTAVAIARPAERAVSEVCALPAEQTLLESGPYSVGYFSASQAPNLLHEIGRQRELAFRRVGEGTGKELDLDSYDEHYLHLFAWQKEKNELVGAYRVGPTDRILASCGPKGLYTTTLFKFRPGLLAEISPALELGRSFVRPEYQCAHMPLLMLWKGIARYVALNPQYKRLFGVVSISNNYKTMSQQLMAEFLRQNHYLADLGQQITPKTPPKFAGTNNWDSSALSRIRSVEELNELIGQIEPELHGVPVLLRQYLKLSARMLGMNVDRKFGQVLDALMITDLTQVAPAVLVRYMGKEDTASFLGYYGMSIRGSA